MFAADGRKQWTMMQQQPATFQTSQACAKQASIAAKGFVSLVGLLPGADRQLNGVDHAAEVIGRKGTHITSR